MQTILALNRTPDLKWVVRDEVLGHLSALSTQIPIASPDDL